MPKHLVRLTESDLRRIIEEVVEKSLNTVNLQLINGFFYPTDGLSVDILKDEFEIGRIPEERFHNFSAKLVKRGYKLAVSDYNPKPSTYYDGSFDLKIGGLPKPQKNPCTKCGFNGLCDSDECGKKGYRLYSKKKQP